MLNPRYIVVNQESRWKIVQGGRRFPGDYSSKSQALSRAIAFAEQDGNAGRRAAVLVRHEDGRFITEWCSGRTQIETRQSGHGSSQVINPRNAWRSRVRDIKVAHWYCRLDRSRSGRVHNSTRLAIGAKITGAIYGKNVGKSGSCTVYPTLDGADRTSANLCGLFVRKAGCPDQYE